MLGTACAVAFAESLVAPNESDTWCQTGGVTPSLAELLTDDPRKWVGLVPTVPRSALTEGSSSLVKKKNYTPVVVKNASSKE